MMCRDVCRMITQQCGTGRRRTRRRQGACATRFAASCNCRQLCPSSTRRTVTACVLPRRAPTMSRTSPSRRDPSLTPPHHTECQGQGGWREPSRTSHAGSVTTSVSHSLAIDSVSLKIVASFMTQSLYNQNYHFNLYAMIQLKDCTVQNGCSVNQLGVKYASPG